MIKDIELYKNMYFNDYVNLLSSAFDYVLCDLEVDVDFFESLFCFSKYPRELERLNPGIISGMSGVEFALKLLENTQYGSLNKKPTIKGYRTPFYWAGYALANYQFKTKKRFKDIFSVIHLNDILSMYKVYHEMDITNFIDDVNKKFENSNTCSKLKTIREIRGLSQSELSKLSNVSLRSIQLYEQKVNDIDKAQAHTLYKLSMILCCDIEELLESPEA